MPDTPKPLHEPTLACTGCGSRWTDAELAERRRADPRIISCCPERDMQPLQATTLRMRTPEELATGLDELRKRGISADDAGLLAAAASYIEGATGSLREHMAEVGRLRTVIRVNALRWNPALSHEQIDEVIRGA